MPVRHKLQGIPFEWDAAKAAANRRKHGVEFEDACEAFLDPFLRPVDAGHSHAEAREGILGVTTGSHLLHVVYVERDEVFRIISARRATRPERRLYEGK